LAGKSVFLLGEDIPGLALAGDPESLAREHPLWARSIQELGPWEETGALSIAQGSDKFRHAGIKGWLSTKTHATGVFLCFSCSSALDLAWQLWQWGLFQDWDAVIAIRQWAGRGQLRRPWSSLPGNLHVVWRHPPLPSGWRGLVSLVPAWLSARVLSQLEGRQILIKWPNDLLWRDGKVGGILVEQRNERTLVGLGVNLEAAPQPAGLRESVVGGAALRGRINPVNCWNLLVSEYVNWYQNILPSLHPEDFLQNFSAVLAWKGRPVLLHEHGCENGLPAVVLGISAEGGLKVSVEGVTRTVFPGDIRLASCSASDQSTDLQGI